MKLYSIQCIHISTVNLGRCDHLECKDTQNSIDKVEFRVDFQLMLLHRTSIGCIPKSPFER